jgi:hypothetical protein
MPMKISRTATLMIASMALCRGQEVVPARPVQGDLLDWSGDRSQGELVFRAADNRVFQCWFDSRTDFERGDRRVDLSASDKGAAVEVLPDSRQPSGCYVKSVRFAPATANHTVSWPGRPADALRPSLDLISGRGDLTMAGVVVKIGAHALLLRTRSNERKLILLRPDTRYFGGGEPVEHGNLAVNTLVFIRAGKSLEDEVEAYQVVWGEILEPIIEPSNY